MQTPLDYAPSPHCVNGYRCGGTCKPLGTTCDRPLTGKAKLYAIELNERFTAQQNNEEFDTGTYIPDFDPRNGDTWDTDLVTRNQLESAIRYVINSVYLDSADSIPKIQPAIDGTGFYGEFLDIRKGVNRVFSFAVTIDGKEASINYYPIAGVGKSNFTESESEEFEAGELDEFDELDIPTVVSSRAIASYNEALGAMVDSIYKLVVAVDEDGGSDEEKFEKLQVNLAESLDAIPKVKLANVIAEAMGAAYLGGRYEVETEGTDDAPSYEEAGDRFKHKSLWKRAYNEAKSKFDIFPSAYASAYIAKRYRELVRGKGLSVAEAFNYEEDEVLELTEEIPEVEDFDLRKWFNEDWVRISADGEIMGACGDRSDKEGFPKCLPRAKAERASAVRRKREKVGKNHKGKAVPVATIADHDREFERMAAGTEADDFGARIQRIVKWQGFDIGVEYLPHDVRFAGTDHERVLSSGYGHIRGYVGADKEALDCYLFTGFFREIDDDEPSDRIFEVTQLRRDGSFDEHKFMIGYGELEEAQKAYLKEMPESFFGGIQEATKNDLEKYKKQAL
jgi:hypothetical protein